MSFSQFSPLAGTAGEVPAQRSEAGISPAGAADGLRSVPIGADTDGRGDPRVASLADELADAGPDVDETPSLPINPQPFGASPARLAGRGPSAARRLVSPQEAASSNRKLTPE